MSHKKVFLKTQEEEGKKRENDEEVNLRYIISTYVNITMYLSI
jgi:hypothetical protein